jgi:hypothetical protein
LALRVPKEKGRIWASSAKNSGKASYSMGWMSARENQEAKAGKVK